MLSTLMCVIWHNKDSQIVGSHNSDLSVHSNPVTRDPGQTVCTLFALAS